MPQDDITFVCRHMRPWDEREFMALSNANSRAELAEHLTARFPNYPDLYGFYCDDDPVGVGAMVQARPGVVTIGFLATDDFPKIALPIAKWVRRTLFPQYREAGVHRIECVSIEGHDEAHKWIRMCGLKQEAPPFRGYGRGGESYCQFSWVSDDVCAFGA